MKFLPIQNNFSAGELSPRFNARADIPGYQAGLQLLENFIPTTHGPIMRRPGTQYVAHYSGTMGKLFQFPVYSTLGFVVAITDEPEINVTDIHGQGHGKSDNDNLLTNGRFITLGTSWTTATTGTGAVAFQIGISNLTLGAGGLVTSYAAIRQQVTGLTTSQDHTITVNADAEGDAIMQVRIGTTAGGTEVASYTFAGNETQYTFNTGANSSLYIEVRLSKTDNELTEAQSREVYLVLLTDDSVAAVPISFTSPWTDQAEIRDIQASITPDGSTMYFFTHFTAPQKLTYSRATNVWNFAAVTWSTVPPEWTTGNYPGACCFFQGRLWAGGTPNEPNTFWSSRSGVYEDMYIASGTDADDPLSFNMSKYGQINWMAGVKNLIIGLDTGEYIISSESGVIQPSDIMATQQSANGSALIQPVEIGNNVVYVSPDGRKCRDVGFKWTEDAWVSRDITYVSEHITEDNLIRQIVFAQNPENLLLMVTNQGQMLGCTYEYNNQIIGWCRMLTDGFVHSVTTVMISGKNHSNILVTRNVNDEQHLHLELFDEKYFMDGYHEEMNVTTQITQGAHLAGQEVSVLIDGAVHPNVTLDEDGVADLQWSGDLCVYGLPFTSTAQTLPMDRGHPQGSGMSTRKGMNKIYVRLINSALPYISGSFPPDRSPGTPMGDPEPLRTGDVFVTNLGWDQYAYVVIIQTLPLPCMVGGIFGEADQEVI